MGETAVATMTKRYDELVEVERDAGMPSAFRWRGRRYEVRDVIGRWLIEGRWWEDGRDREYWRVEAGSGAVLWHNSGYAGPSMLHGNIILKDTSACDLLTGAPKMRLRPVSPESMRARQHRQWPAR